MKNDNIPDAQLLIQLENLAALSNNSGLIEIKPFRNWKGTPYWANAIFKMRLCNSDETLEIASQCAQFPIDAKDRVNKRETLIRSIYAINEITIAGVDELAKYNNKHNTNLGRIEYLRIWIGNLEQLVTDTLFDVYIGLQMKQLRLVLNQCVCESCGQPYDKSDLPKDSKKIFYSIGEIVCGNCIEHIDLLEFDFNEKQTQTIEPVIQTELVKNNDLTSNPGQSTETSIEEESAPYTCVCGKEFNILEEFVDHRTGCSEANE